MKRTDKKTLDAAKTALIYKAIVEGLERGSKYEKPYDKALCIRIELKRYFNLTLKQSAIDGLKESLGIDC